MKTGTIGIGLLIAAIFGGTGAGALAATGQVADDMPESRPLRMLVSGQFGHLLALRSELGITTEQRTQIREIVTSHRQELAVVLKPVAEKRRVLRDATLADNPNEATIRAAADELGKAIGDAAVVGARVKAEVHRLLTPEQREKISEFRSQSQAAVDRFFGKLADVR